MTTTTKGAAAAARRRTVVESMLHPPLRDRRFWLVIGGSGVVFIVHEMTDGRLGLPFFPTVAHQATLILFALPIMYAALSFGMVGASGTTLLAIVLTVADVLMEVPSANLFGDVGVTALEIIMFGVTAVVVGRRVEAERAARAAAELAGELRHRQTAAYAAHLLGAQEEERRRIAHELHDQPVQALVLLCRRLDRARQRLPSDGAAAADLAMARSNAEEIIAGLRTIAYGLRPPALDDLGLVACVRRLTVDLHERSPTKAVFTVVGEEVRLLPTTELALYRIAQEALSNVERHASARHVVVRLSFEAAEVSLDVRDDGAGFVIQELGSAPVPPPSLGIIGMEERAELIGGVVSVTSAVGHGTRVHAVVPRRERRPRLSDAEPFASVETAPSPAGSR